MNRPQVLELRSSPHLRSGSAVHVIMRNVIWALLPTVAFAVFSFGLAALLTLIVALASCVITEAPAQPSDAAPHLGDGSVWITGLLYGLTLPPSLPLWMTAVGGVIAVAMGKTLFGGLGQNPFNPALVGRAFLQAAFPVSMTTWTPALSAERFSTLPRSLLAPPFASPVYDAVSAATPLALMKFEQGQITATNELMFGLTSGSTGETGALLIAAGGVYLAGPAHARLAHSRGDPRHRGRVERCPASLAGGELPDAPVHALFRRAHARRLLHGHGYGRLADYGDRQQCSTVC